jgi:hypothetical protein
VQPARKNESELITPDMFPMDILTDLMGREYFMRIEPPRKVETTLD